MLSSKSWSALWAMPVNRNSASGWNLPWMKRLKNAAAAAPSKQWS